MREPAPQAAGGIGTAIPGAAPSPSQRPVPEQAAVTVPALLRARTALNPDVPALWAQRTGSGWQTITWREFSQAVVSTSAGLRALGLRRGDRVGLMANTSPRWDVVQFAVMAAGGVVVGLDPHDTDQRLAQMAAQCGLAGVVAQDEGLLSKLGAACTGTLRFSVTLDTPLRQGVVSYDDLARLGQVDASVDGDRSRADDEALVIFTSGTTGEPKGISYSHRQVCGAVDAVLRSFPDIAAGSRLACWLPLSNLFQRMINFCAIGRGAQTYYIDDPRSVMTHVSAVSPHLFIGVPRFYEKLHAGIAQAIAMRPAWQRGLARWAIGAGDRRARALRAGRPLGAVDRLAASIAERLVLARVRGVLGQDIRFLISGSAPMPVWLLERFHALGFLVLEAYGMSECVVPIASNTVRNYRFGTVGRPMEGLEVKLAADGELMVRGPGVSSGYLGDAADRNRLDPEGYLASGDYASIDAEGFITLLGRKSELFKTSTGRRIAPSLIEGQLRQVAYVEQAVVLGANRPFLLAVVAVSEPALRSRLPVLSSNGDVVAAMAAAARADLAAVVASLPDYQRPAAVVLTTRPFTVTDGLVTPNLKVRRAQVEKTFSVHIDELAGLLEARPESPITLEREQGSVLLLST